MKTLIIHPHDRSTDFLCTLYEKIENKTVLRTCDSKEELIKQIQEHDRVMIMGHGCPYGLFNTGHPTEKRGSFHGMNYVIGDDMVMYLENNPNNVYIWCNADQWVQRHPNIQGFYTGMFISEVGEAHFMGVRFPENVIPQEWVDESNYGFCKIFSNHSNEDCITLHENVTREYQTIADENDVAKYNHERLYMITDKKQIVNEEFNEKYVRWKEANERYR